ncbi:MAG: putative signal transduction histidine kinase [Solirubrobacterales bacterium]|nr:putative signal transduction histidine kinase [Solirubrobacterales bacterium]
MRVIFVALATAGGAGIVLYVVLALVLPRAEATAPASARAVRVNAKETAGVALLALSALLTLRGIGLWWSDTVVAPAVLTSTGIAVIWRQSSMRGRRDADQDADGERAAPLRTPGGVPFGPGVATPLGELPRMGPRLIGGAVLVAAGGATLLQATAAVGTLRDLAVATIVVLAGVTLIFGTSWFGLVRTLRVERAERIRSQERAEMAAHLHDSVLQTLALIQRHSGDGREVATLARRQERELRDWLAGRPIVTAEDTGTTLASALYAMAAGVEADHRVPVEVVVVGDRPLDERVRALVAAAREAAVNAAVHAGTGHVDLYAEVIAGRAEVFVRDRGTGFDAHAVPPARRGVRESIVGRMERHGGTATVRTAPGEGTEVELVLP